MDDTPVKTARSARTALLYMTRAAVIAALYAAVTMALPEFSYGPLQVRFSEALTLLPAVLPEAVPGLFVGCFAANILSSYGPLDMVFGSLATLSAALLTRLIFKTLIAKKENLKWLAYAAAALPPVLINAVVIGAVIAFSDAYTPDGGLNMVIFRAVYLPTALSVGAGQSIACFGLGAPLLAGFRKVLKRGLALPPAGGEQ